MNVQWVWPSDVPYAERHEALKKFCIDLADVYGQFSEAGHPVEVGHAVLDGILPVQLRERDRQAGGEAMPWLAALVCASPYDRDSNDRRVLWAKDKIKSQLGFSPDYGDAGALTFAEPVRTDIRKKKLKYKTVSIA